MVDEIVRDAEFEEPGGPVQAPLQDYEARVNVTYAGQNADLPDPVDFQASDADIRRWVTEAVQGGTVPGIPVANNANFQDSMIERFAANDVYPYNRIVVRPKTTFG